MNATNMVGWAGAAPTVKEGGLAPNAGATRIFFELKEGDYAQLEICVRDDVRHLLKKISVYEVMDRDHNDLAVDLYVNDEFVLRAAEGQETPWFFDRRDLEDTVRKHGEVWTYKEILGWFKHPIDELEEEVSN
jgi:hypothetical protein